MFMCFSFSSMSSHSNYLKTFVISSLTERLIGHDVSSKLLYGDHCLIVLDRQFLRLCGRTHGTPFCPGQPLLICFLPADIKQHEDCQHHYTILLYAREHAPSITKTTMQVYVSVKNSTSLPQRIFFPLHANSLFCCMRFRPVQFISNIFKWCK